MKHLEEGPLTMTGTRAHCLSAEALELCRSQAVSRIFTDPKDLWLHAVHARGGHSTRRKHA